MSVSVSVNPPKTPVTEGSNGVAAATVPNVCKMPGPPAPFVPTPLPNIGRSGLAPKGYSKKTTIEGKKIAVRGATFGSMGDVASKGTGGGLVSSCAEGATSFVGPGSMNVKVEGKNVQLLGDPMLNNCGPGGSPANAATLLGVIQASALVVAVPEGACAFCGARHAAFGETRATKAAAASLAMEYRTALHDELVAALATGVRQTLREAGETSNRPTMLAVVVCQCGRRCAGQSGATTTALVTAAARQRMESPPATPVVAGRSTPWMTPERFTRLRWPGTGTRWQTQKESFHREFGKAWAKADGKSKLSAAARGPGETFYPPGNCAAQKTVVFAREPGCFPVAMTERWHHPKGKKVGGAMYYVDAVDGKVKSAYFNPRRSVPPCGSCNLLLPYLLCLGGQTTCGHR